MVSDCPSHSVKAKTAVTGGVKSVLFVPFNQPCASSLCKTPLPCQGLLWQHKLLWRPVDHFSEGLGEAQAAGGGERGRDVCHRVGRVAGQHRSDGKAGPDVLGWGFFFFWFPRLTLRSNCLHSVTRQLLFQATPPCRRRVSSFVATSHRPRMEMHRLNPSKVEY